MPHRLDKPDSIDDLYLDRDEPVEPWRPVMQGDVFTGVAIVGLEEHSMVIVVSHPCSMRGAGGQLKPKLQAVPVDPHAGVQLADWTTITRIFPLPELMIGSSDHYAARLTEFGMVNTQLLDLDRRVACLSEVGILLLQQKFVASLTRVAVGLDALDKACRPVLAEAELLEDWLGDLAALRCERGEDRTAVLAEEAHAFDQYLSEPSHDPLRQALSSEAGQSAVRRTVRGEIARRRAALESD